MNQEEFKKSMNELVAKSSVEQKAMIQSAVNLLKSTGFKAVLEDYDFVYASVLVTLEYGIDKVEDFVQTSKMFDENSVKSLRTAYMIYYNKLLNSSAANTKIYLLSVLDTFSQKLNKHIIKFVIFDGQHISIPMLYISEADAAFEKIKEFLPNSWYATNIMFNNNTVTLPDEIKIIKLNEELPNIQNILETQFMKLTSENLYSAINSTDFYYVDAILVDKYRETRDKTLYRVFLVGDDNFLNSALYVAVDKSLNVPLRSRIFCLTTLMPGKQNSSDIIMFPVYVSVYGKNNIPIAQAKVESSEMDFYNQQGL